MEPSQTFNLIDVPWIVAQDHAGAKRTLSLHQTLAESPRLSAIGGEVPTQAFAITRVLLAVIRRAVEWGGDPVARWSEVWTSGHLPAEEIDSYLDSVRHRFDLLDRHEPFFQVADLATAKGEFKPVDLLLIDVPTGEKYFTTRAGRGTESLSLAEAARWLVHCQAFDISGIKSADPRDPRGKGGKGYPIGVAWAGQLGGVIFEGGNLFETLMLNTVLVDQNGQHPKPDDKPAWERVQANHLERDLLIPSGPADVLTWQSRRIRLVCKEGRVDSVLVANGDPLESHNKYNVEYLTGWRYSEPQSKKFGDNRYLPLQWDPERALWRGVESLLTDTVDADGKHGRQASGAAHWLAELLDREVLTDDLIVRPHAYGLQYINQSSVVGASVDDSLPLHLALVGRVSEARGVAARAAEAATAAVGALGQLASRLVEAAGGTGEGDRQAAQAEAYFTLDGPYRAWVRSLTDESVVEAAPEKDWHLRVHTIVGEIGDALISEALRGLSSTQWMQASRADAMFRGALRKSLPHAFKEQFSTEGG